MKNYITQLTSEKTLTETLKRIMEEIKQESLLGNMEDGDFLKMSFGEEYEGNFVPFQVSSAAIRDYFQGHDVLFLKDDSEAAFYEACCSYPKSIQYVVQLLDLIIYHNLAVGKFKVPYKDDENVFGLTLVAALVRTSSSNCKFLGEFLRTLDMDHGVNEVHIVIYSFERYGCCLDTMSLLAIYLFPGGGQNTDEVLEYLVREYPIDDFLGNESNFSAFLSLTLSEFHQIHPGHKDLYSDFYIDGNSRYSDSRNTNLFRIFREVKASYTSS